MLRQTIKRRQHVRRIIHVCLVAFASVVAWALGHQVGFVNSVLPGSSPRDGRRLVRRSLTGLTEAVCREAGVPEEKARGVAELAATVKCDGSCREPFCDPLTLLRFFNARGGNVDRASEMYDDAVRWRAGYPMNDIMKLDGEGEGCLYDSDGSRLWTDSDDWPGPAAYNNATLQELRRHVAFTRHCQSTPSGEPVFVWRLRTDDYDSFEKNQLEDALLESYIRHIEDALQVMRSESLKRNRLVRGRFVIDVGGLSLESARFMPALRRCTDLGNSYYPEVTESVTMINAPAAAAFLWKIICTFLPMALQRKVEILGTRWEDRVAERIELPGANWTAIVEGEEPSAGPIDRAGASAEATAAATSDTQKTMSVEADPVADATPPAQKSTEEMPRHGCDPASSSPRPGFWRRLLAMPRACFLRMR
eukprot:TRINITY_DN50952_c0_g1_i1.p1 TRINITY_DN50952_c0_g1~~TRINITY_DN50952_c0_g1_i1.p1  ORF type:complete len:421 (-),score=41.17 TRINITY_DN50952_c0_g1_i1:469-1731(-)